MNMIPSTILPRLPEVARLLAEDPNRNDFGSVDLATLAALIFFAIVFGMDRAPLVVEFVQRHSRFDAGQVEFLLHQYDGRKPRRHLWRSDRTGRYTTLIPAATT